MVVTRMAGEGHHAKWALASMLGHDGVVVAGLKQRILWAAALGRIATNAEDPAALGAAYRHLEASGLITTVWRDGDDLPSEVELTPGGRVAHQHSVADTQDRRASGCD
jgi:hypothetical protein